MEITQLIANGGVVATIGAILYTLNERRLKQVEDNKVNGAVCEERHEHITNTLGKVDARLEEGNGIMQDLRLEIVQLQERARLCQSCMKTTGGKPSE